MINLGKMKKITDLRKVWPHEAHDFSKWLALPENLALLSDAIGINISLEELESPVGDFSVDLFASEEGTKRKIIIENQLEDTNHDHLGKIITYASGKGADIIVWIVKRARDEHRQAVEWLNQHTDEDIAFFLVEIELWQIDDSQYAPRFNIVEQPNDWAKSIKYAEGLNSLQKLQLEFWQAFNDYAYKNTAFSAEFSKRKAQPFNWYDFAIGRPYWVNATFSTVKKRVTVGVYISNNKEIYQHFGDKKAEIEGKFDTPFEWSEGKKDCRFHTYIDGDIKNKDEWNTIFDWMMNTILKMKKTVLECSV